MSQNVDFTLVGGAGLTGKTVTAKSFSGSTPSAATVSSQFEYPAGSGTYSGVVVLPDDYHGAVAFFVDGGSTYVTTENIDTRVTSGGGGGGNVKQSFDSGVITVSPSGTSFSSAYEVTVTPGGGTLTFEALNTTGAFSLQVSLYFRAAAGATPQLLVNHSALAQGAKPKDGVPIGSGKACSFTVDALEAVYSLLFYVRTLGVGGSQTLQFRGTLQE